MTTLPITISLPDRPSDDEEDMFADLEPMDPFEIKKDHLAAQLAALMSCSGKTRSGLADELGWKKSRITNILSGRANLTVKTIWEFVSHCGYDFDLIFRAPNVEPALQPWQAAKTRTSTVVKNVTVSPDYYFEHPLGSVLIEIQSAEQVKRDIEEGNHKSHYFNVSIDVSRAAAEPPTLPLLSASLVPTFRPGTHEMTLVKTELK